jgi:hypothetical protein
MPSSPDAGQAVLGTAPPPALDATTTPDLSTTPPANLSTLQASLTAKNPSGVSLDILPNAELKVGEKIVLRVATKKQGYLVLVDVDAAGKLTQIYPNRRSLMLAQDNQETANLIKPGERVTIPQRGNPYAGFEFIASPPAGVAMIIAILSDRPVQMLDLPDIPPSLVGQSAAVSYLTNWTRNLRIARAGGGPDHLEQANWSFAAKLYAIR